MTHNLDENTQEYFEFILGGNTYKMRYPNTEEILEAKKLTDDTETGNSKEQLKWVYKFISAEEGVPSIEEAVNHSNIKKLNKFNKMLQEEFSPEE